MDVDPKSKLQVQILSQPSSYRLFRRLSSSFVAVAEV
jgi:hypothetical protein